MLFIFIKVMLWLLSLAGKHLLLDDLTDNSCIMHLQCKMEILDLSQTPTVIKNNLFFS